MTIDLRVGTGSLPLITLRQKPMGGLSLPPRLPPLLLLSLGLSLKQWTLVHV